MGLTPDKITLVKPDGTRIPDISAFVQSKIVFIRDGNLPIEEGDAIERVLPSNLIEEYLVLDPGYFSVGPYRFQTKVQKKSSLPPQRQVSPTTIFQIGDNPKVNINSEDNSINTVTENDFRQFEDIKKALMNQISDEKERTICINSLNELQESVGKKTYIEKYQQFIATAANHIAIISPFLPYLTQLFPK